MHTYTSVLWCCVVYTHLLHEFGINNRIGSILSCISGAGCSCCNGYAGHFFSTISQSSDHLKLISSTWQWVPCIQMASTIIRTQSKRAALGGGVTGDWCSRQICTSCVMTSCQYKPASQRDVSSTLLRICRK